MARALVEEAAPSTIESIILLGVCGFAFASKIMVSKAALDAGIDPFQLGVIGNLGAGILLYGWLLAGKKHISLARRNLFLYAALGIVSVAFPTVLSFFVVEHVGAAYTATVYALSPVLTMGFAAGFGVERMAPLRSVGIAIGLMSMLGLVQQQLSAINFGQPVWVVVALLIPGCAALGNIIRSAFWPKDSSALAFGCATLFTSSAALALLSPVLSVPSQWRLDDVGRTLWLCGFILISALSYVLNFRLQKVAGPVVFSQIGYWGTGFGVMLAAILFGDVPTVASVIGLAVMIAGGVLANRRRS